MTETNRADLDFYLESRACKIKKNFISRELAKKEAKRMTQVKRNGRIRAYKCRYCPLYHIGHNKLAKVAV